MTETASGVNRWHLAMAISVFAACVLLYLLRPGLTAEGTVPVANLHLALPFVVIAVFCFQIGLEGLAPSYDRTGSERGRTRVKTGERGRREVRKSEDAEEAAPSVDEVA